MGVPVGPGDAFVVRAAGGRGCAAVRDRVRSPLARIGIEADGRLVADLGASEDPRLAPDRCVCVAGAGGPGDSAGLDGAHVRTRRTRDVRAGHGTGTVSAGQERCPGGGAEGIRTPDLLIAKASPGSLSSSGPVRTRAFDGLHVQYPGSGVRAGCAVLDGQERATDPIASLLARRRPGSRVAGGHRIATRSALDAGRRRAHRRRSGRRLGGDLRKGP